jgi:hypothetical protein
MAGKPKVFVTRVLPEAGLARIRAETDAEVWTDALPTPAVATAGMTFCMLIGAARRLVGEPPA